MIFTKNKEGVRAFRAKKYKKYMAGKFTRAAHLWREITEIEYSDQKMAQEVWNIKLDWKSLLLFNSFADQVQSYCVNRLIK